MTPKECILADSIHEKPDQISTVMGASNATGIKLAPYQQLKAILVIESTEHYLCDWPDLGTINPDEKILEQLDTDVRWGLDWKPDQFRFQYANQESGSNYVDSLDADHGEIEPGVWIPLIHPLKDATSIIGLENYPWPDMVDPSCVARTRERARYLAEENPYRQGIFPLR